VQQFLSNYGQASGVPLASSLVQLNRILKGHRPGELTILTGRTGQVPISPKVFFSFFVFLAS
jgi:hypothetical protein